MDSEKYLKWIIPSVKNRRVPKNIEEGQFNFRIKKAEEQLKLYIEFLKISLCLGVKQNIKSKNNGGK